MAVYKRAYARYQGGYTSPARRFWVVTRYAFSDLFASRAFTAFYMMLSVPFLINAVLIYVANSALLQQYFNVRGGGAVINPFYFFTGLQIQCWFSTLLAAWVGPSLVSPDLVNGALPLFLARPFSRREYVVGKSLVLIVLISLITWVPGLILFGLEASLAGAGWARANYIIPFAMIAVSVLWAAFLCAISLAISAWVKWRVVATLVTFAIFFLPSGFGEALNATLNTYWGRLLNFWYLMLVVGHYLFRVTDHLERWNNERFPLGAAIFMLCSVTALCMLLLNQRLRAKEVVRG